MNGTSFIRVVVLLAIVALASGCGESLAKDTKALVFSHGALKPEIGKALKHLIKEFEAENPKLKVIRHELPPATDLQRNFYGETFASQSKFIDVLELDVIWTAELAAQGLLQPLDKKWKKDYLDSSLETAIYDDKLYALPFFCTAGVIFYRRDLLKKHNLQPPTTWKELQAQAKKIGKAEGIAGLLFQGQCYEGMVCHFLEIYRSLGGKIKYKKKGIGLDKALVQKALEHLQGLIREGITPATVLAMTEKESLEQFRAGKSVFLRAWNDLEKNLPGHGLSAEQIGMMPLPQFGKQPAVPTIGGWLLGINPRSENKDEALKLIRFLTNAKSQAFLAKSLGRPPTFAALYKENRKIELRNPQLHRLILASAKQRPVSPNYHQFSLIIQQDVHAALTGDIKLAEAVQSLTRRLASVSLPKKLKKEFPKKLDIPATVY